MIIVVEAESLTPLVYFRHNGARLQHCFASSLAPLATPLNNAYPVPLRSTYIPPIQKLRFCLDGTSDKRAPLYAIKFEFFERLL